jgi:hypothetical protein
VRGPSRARDVVAGLNEPAERLHGDHTAELPADELPVGAHVPDDEARPDAAAVQHTVLGGLALPPRSADQQPRDSAIQSTRAAAPTSSASEPEPFWWPPCRPKPLKLWPFSEFMR